MLKETTFGSVSGGEMMHGKMTHVKHMNQQTPVHKTTVSHVCFLSLTHTHTHTHMDAC